MVKKERVADRGNHNVVKRREERRDKEGLPNERAIITAAIIFQV